MSQEGNLLHYEGKSGAVFKIWLRNLFFTILTIGLYRPWAKTRMRRYIYSHFTFIGERFQYTGTGRELFIANVKVFGTLFLVAIAIEVFLRTQSKALSGGLNVAFLYLMYLGQYTGKRYRLSRTKWRGIRGGMVGNPQKYAALGLQYLLLNIITLGLIIPRNDMKLRKRMVDDMRFGQQMCEFDENPRPLYKVHFITWLLAIPTLGFSRLWYQASLRNHYLRQMKAGSLRFTGTHTGWTLCRLVSGNILLYITIIGIPFALSRYARYYAQHTYVLGDLSEVNLGQISDSGYATGDALDDAYDADLDFDMGLL